MDSNFKATFMTIDARKTIVLVDPYSSGHHITYAKYAVLAAKKSGFIVILICNKEMASY